MVISTLTSSRKPTPYRFLHRRQAKQAEHHYGFLREFVGDRTKIATIGGDPETQFEQAFASLAYSYIKDKAPRLLDYMIGFQLVDRNDDNTKAVGIFGFKLGKSWVYAPVFFLNGDLKGHELMYLKEQDVFVPMKENWVNYVLSKKPHVLGDPDGRNMQDIGVQQPDIRSLSIPPYNSKYGSADPVSVYPNIAHDGWAEPSIGFRGIYSCMTRAKLEDSFVGGLSKHAGYSPGDVLHKVVRLSPGLCKLAMDICDTYPAIGEAMERFHGTDFFKEALQDLRAEVSKPKQSFVLQTARTPEKTGATHVLFGTQRKRAAGPPVEIKVREDVAITENGDQVDGEEQGQLARDGYLVKDHRTGEEVSKAYNTQVEVQLVNPDGTGLYEVLQRDGTFVRAVLLADPHSTQGREKFCTAVRLDPKDWINAHRTTLFAKPNTSTREDFQEWYDGLSDSSELRKGGTYVVVSENGEGSVPFRIREKLNGDGRYRIHALDYADRHRPAYLPATDQYVEGDYDAPMSCGPELLYLEDREGRTFRSSQNILHVPREHKVLTIEDPETESGDGEDIVLDGTQSEDTSFEPGAFSDLQTQILQKTAALKLYCDGNELSVNGSHLMTKLSGLFCLIRDHGLREKEAKTMIKQAEVARLQGKQSHYRIRYAPYYAEKRGYGNAEMLQGGPVAPGIPEPEMGYDAQYGNVPSQYMETHLRDIPELDSAYTDRDTYNPLPEHVPDPMAMQDAQRAGQMGQKEVFDTSMVNSLLKAVRHDSLVDRFMGDLMKALDRLGRIRFMMLWHNDEFSDRYGKNSMPDLEDSLVNTFESLGDLTLELKEKDVEPIMRGDQNEPDIEEVAGN